MTGERYGWKILIWGCLTFLSLSLMGQQTIPPLRNFSTKDGIIELAIHAISRDQNGLLWLGTPNGLHTYDGHLALPFRGHELLASTQITSLYIDDQDQIWAGTFNQGLFFIDSTRQIVKHFQFDPDDPTGISANRVHDVVSSGTGKMIIALEKVGFDLYDPASGDFINFNLIDTSEASNPNRNNTIICICSDPFDPGIFWFGTLDGLVRFDLNSKKFDHYLCTSDTSQGPGDLNGRENTIKSLHCQEKVLYAGTWGGGLSVFDKITHKWNNYKFESAFPASAMRNDVIGIVPKSETELWILAYQHELAVFNKRTEEFSFHGYNYFRSYHVDDRGTIWLGTLDKGLFCLFPEMGNTQKHYLPFDLTDMIPAPGNSKAYAGAFGKSVLLEIDLEDDSYRTILFQPFFNKDINFIYDLQYSRDSTLYLLGLSGVYRLDEEKKSIEGVFSPFELPGNKDKITGSTSFLIDDRENLWYATKFDGLYRYNLNDDQITHYPPEKNKGHTAWVSDLMEDENGRIWYGSGEGFGFFDPETEIFSGFPNSLKRSAPDSLAFSAITSLTEDDRGNIWLGDLHKGLGMITDISTGTIQSYTTASAPMINDAILELEADKKNVIWLRTREGLSRYFQAEKSFDHLGKMAGITGIREIVPWSDSEMVITANNGYYRIPVDLEAQQKILPQILIEKIQVFDKNYPTRKALNQLDTIELNYRDNFFSVDFSSIDFNYPQLTKHRYKMDGLHDDWIDIGKRQSINFTRLPGGHYTLHIQAGYRENLWGPEKTLFIQIYPPFWLKIWFWAISFCVLISLIWFVYKNRINKVRKKASEEAAFEKKLSEAKLTALQAQMNPHFLFNCLNSIKLLTLENEAEKASDYLTRFSRLVRLILNSSKQLLVPLSDEVEMLRLYIEMESLRFDHEFSYQLDLDSSVDVLKSRIPPMIVQVFVENAIKHGLRPKVSDKKLEIWFTSEEHFLICRVRDNGIGRMAASKKQNALKKESMGIRNTLERLEHLRQVHGISVSIEIVDLYEKVEASGTLVEIRVDMDSI